MVGHIRLQNLRCTIEAVVRDRIDGDIVELGIWRGGALLYARAVLEALSASDHRVVGVDAFETLTGYNISQRYLAVAHSFVVDMFKRFDLWDDDQVVLVKGLFKDVLPRMREEYTDSGRSIAVLRLDGNFYDSHIEALYYLYDLVPVGGFVIFDDWGHAIVQQAWHDFATAVGCPEKPQFIKKPEDENGGYFRKQEAVLVDVTKLPPPRDVSIKMTRS